MADTTPRPVALPVSPGTIPDELKSFRQWVNWRYEHQPKRNAVKPWTKVPKNPATGANASPTDPQTWAAFAQASVVFNGNADLDGIGFVLTAADPYVAIDLDGCRDPDTGEIQPWAQAIIDHFRSYTEISPSAAGIRILLNGQLPPGGRKKGAIEVYDRARYVTLTGAHITDTPATIEARQAELDAWHRHVFGEPTTRGEPTSKGHDPASSLSDDAILQKALGARNGDKLARLWGGDLDGYPSHSEADLALCSALAFWTSDDAQIDRLLRRSGLYRAKWERADYRDRTITRAIESAHEHWQGVSAESSHGGPSDHTSEATSDEHNASQLWDGTDLVLLPLRPSPAYRGPRTGVRHG
jgi:putative DNA primase/helicase